MIETKNYQGTIYGGKDRKEWLINGKFKMLSPLVQNYGHIQALKLLIPTTNHDKFISIVSFTKRCTFKIDEELRKISSNELVIYDIELTEFINRKISILKLQHKEPILSTEEIQHMYKLFSEANITDLAIRKSHIESIEKKKETKNECSICQKEVSDKISQFCLSNPKFEGKIYCYEHQKKG